MAVAGPGEMRRAADLTSQQEQIPLQGETIVGYDSLDRTNLIFGSQQVGTVSQAQSVTLTNRTDDLALLVSSVTVSEGFGQTTTCGSTLPISIPVSGNCTFQVTFSPTVAGAHDGTLTLVTNAESSPHTVALTGTGTDFDVSANPSPVTISAPGQTGTSTIKVTPLYGFTGTVDLSVASGCPTGATCTFSPSSVTVGSTSAVTSTLTITTSGAASTPPALQWRVSPGSRLPVGSLWLLIGLLALALLLASPTLRRWPAALLFATVLLIAGMWAACGGGSGTQPPPPTPVVSLSAGSLTFNSQNMGTTSAAQSVILTNIGTATLAITSISVAGSNAGDFSQTNTCGTSVSAAANCSISVKFAPTATGARSASVSITDNASGSPHAIGLSGTAVQATTPPGTYPVVVNATSAGLTRQLTLSVTVQ